MVKVRKFNHEYIELIYYSERIGSKMPYSTILLLSGVILGSVIGNISFSIIGAIIGTLIGSTLFFLGKYWENYEILCGEISYDKSYKRYEHDKKYREKLKERVSKNAFMQAR